MYPWSVRLVRSKEKRREEKRRERERERERETGGGKGCVREKEHKRDKGEELR